MTNIPFTPLLMTSACPKKHQLILNRDTGSPWRISRMSYICACSAVSQTSTVSVHHLSSVCALPCPPLSHPHVFLFYNFLKRIGGID